MRAGPFSRDVPDAHPDHQPLPGPTLVYAVPMRHEGQARRCTRRGPPSGAVVRCILRLRASGLARDARPPRGLCAAGETATEARRRGRLIVQSKAARRQMPACNHDTDLPSRRSDVGSMWGPCASCRDVPLALMRTTRYEGACCVERSRIQALAPLVLTTWSVAGPGASSSSATVRPEGTAATRRCWEGSSRPMDRVSHATYRPVTRTRLTKQVSGSQSKTSRRTRRRVGRSHANRTPSRS